MSPVQDTSGHYFSSLSERAAVTRREFLQRLGGLATGAAGGLLAGACAPRYGGSRRSFPLAGADALLVVFSDTHSAYERYPQLLTAVDRVRARYARVPMLIVFNGDLFERGNVVGVRGDGRLDLALLRALGRRAPVVYNLGNHEGALFDLAEAVRRIEACGASVVSNAVDLRTGRPFAPPAADLRIAGERLAVVGLATNDLGTYRAEVRAALSVPDGPDYAAEQLGRLLGDASLRLVLSHEGTVDDRRMLHLVPDGTLVVGGHDHLHYAHRQGATLYVHTGWWGESITLVGVRHGPAGAEWVHEKVPLDLDADGDAALGDLVRREKAAHLTTEELAVVGHTERELPFRDAALLAAAALRDAAGADVGVIANSTFGTGLPAGPVSRYRFDAFIRFDGGVQRAPTDGASLRAILNRSNQFEDTPFDRRTGEYLVATQAGSLHPDRTYSMATVDWVRLNAERYLGTNLDFAPLPDLRLKAVVARRLAR